MSDDFDPAAKDMLAKLGKVMTDETREAHDLAITRARARDFLETCTVRSQLLGSASMLGFAAHAYAEGYRP